MTIGEFINEVRLSHSAHLLASRPELSIDEVKSMSGFNSRTTFGRLFSRTLWLFAHKISHKIKRKKGIILLT
ncbi:helix-turn-helix domain-containing protein [Porphyromonas cangingivalis]|uniref:helix-turn-helix domain-containing protein n=1 Tax=Porphyromonas cangingivalis TaxID=36874 RepID=UPI0009DD56A5